MGDERFSLLDRLGFKKRKRKIELVPSLFCRMQTGVLSPLDYTRKMLYAKVLNLTTYHRHRLQKSMDWVPRCIDLNGNRLAVLYSTGNVAVHDMRPYDIFPALYQIEKGWIDSDRSSENLDIGIYGCIKFKPEHGEWYSTSGLTDVLSIVETESAKVVIKINIGGTKEIYHHLFNPHQTDIMAVASFPRRMSLCDTRTGVETTQFGTVKYEQLTLAWAPYYPNTLLSSSIRDICYWDIRKPNTPFVQLDYPLGPVVDFRGAPELYISRDNNRFLTCASDRIIRIWDYPSTKVISRSRTCIVDYYLHTRLRFEVIEESDPPLLLAPHLENVIVYNFRSLQTLAYLEETEYPLHQLYLNRNTYELIGIGDTFDPVIWKPRPINAHKLY